jgi:type II secretory pathway component PulC
MALTTGLTRGLLAWAIGVSLLSAPEAFSQAPPQPLPLTALPLGLVGVIVDANEPSNSVCLIRCAYPVQRVRTLGPGQTACDVAEVQEVRADTVVIRNLLSSRSELLSLQSANPSTAAPAPQDAREAAPAPPALRRSSEVVSIDLPEASVSHYLANLPELLASARATPRYRSTGFGQASMDGFEIDQVKAGGVVEQMGVKNGDVILDLNGQPLDSLASAIRLFGQARNMTQSRMTVLRSGQRMTFVLNRK